MVISEAYSSIIIIALLFSKTCREGNSGLVAGIYSISSPDPTLEEGESSGDFGQRLGPADDPQRKLRIPRGEKSWDPPNFLPLIIIVKYPSFG